MFDFKAVLERRGIYYIMKYSINTKYKSIENFIKSIPDIFEKEGDTIYKGRNVVKIFEHEGVLFNVKRFKVPNMINRLAYKYFRKSKAERSFLYANRLLELGINTPDPVAYFEYSNVLGLKFSYYVSLHYEYDFTFRELIREEINNCKDILLQFTEFTHKLHANGVYFIDHSPGNTLIKKVDGKYIFSLVDLNRTKFFNKELDLELGIKNFYRLGSTKEMVEVMAEQYAILRDADKEKVLESMMKQTMDHNASVKKKYQKKKKVK